MAAQNLAQTIERNSAAQMMHVMNADICGEPSQNERQIVMRTSAQCRFVDVPRSAVCPKSLFELMLDVEQPDAGGRGEADNRQLDEQECFQTDKPDDRRDHDCDGEIRCHRREPRLPTTP